MTIRSRTRCTFFLLIAVMSSRRVEEDCARDDDYRDVARAATDGLSLAEAQSTSKAGKWRTKAASGLAPSSRPLGR